MNMPARSRGRHSRVSARASRARTPSRGRTPSRTRAAPSRAHAAPVHATQVTAHLLTPRRLSGMRLTELQGIADSYGIAYVGMPQSQLKTAILRATAEARA